ncbi:TPM domain-containing protein [Hymenobacter cavernae]|uniref:TPM domain-containing protein n=1 Tax=Hymenobacter cavernae TaxID=2044852 RepID=A0ABQ1TR37_9BACT|nr:TPM domain-containing protein [Hymenobacter cavernae]GGF01798.1 hypothetical protein GCM10011383_10870 [Hymenobacter cavernae]
MHRFLFFFLLLVSAGLGWPAAAAPADGVLARPSPFRFVTDEAKLLSLANAKTLENGLRHYADDKGTQIVVVTVPTLGGRDVADYARSLGEAWGVGQRGKDNGVVLLLAGQEHKVSVQVGSGLQNKISPDVITRAINQDMTPSFKQGNYFAGLRKGLNTLMAAADPNPPKTQPATAPATAMGSAATTNADLNNDLATTTPAPQADPYTPAPSTLLGGLGIGTLLIGALLIGGVIWFLVRMFRNRSATSTPNTPYGNAPSNTPDFYTNRGNGPTGGGYNRGPAGPQGNGSAPNFYPNQPTGGGMMGGMGNMGGGGSGIGGILATGAAAAAGAYLGNRMASGNDHDTAGNGLSQAGLGAANNNLDPPTNYSGTPSGEFPALGGAAGNDFSGDNAAPDYFSGDYAADDSGDYFSADDNSSYDDQSSDDTGGGGFDDDSDNSGSW